VGVQDAYLDMQAKSVARYSTETLKFRRDIGDVEHAPGIVLQHKLPGRFAHDQQEVAASAAERDKCCACHTWVVLPVTAVSIACNIAVGVGGQPGTATSTGITLATLPQLA
jgi:hypothetical protein